MVKIRLHLKGAKMTNGEIVGESTDEAVERVVGKLLGVEVEESEDPLILRGLGRGLGRALGK